MMNTSPDKSAPPGAAAQQSTGQRVSAPQDPIPGMVAMQANWKQMVGSAKSTWLRISDAELLEADGNPATLTGLVQRAYTVSRDEANLQVRRFFDKNRA